MELVRDHLQHLPTTDSRDDIAHHVFLMSEWSMAMRHLLIKEAMAGVMYIDQPPGLMLMTVLTVEYPSQSSEVGLLSVPFRSQSLSAARRLSLMFSSSPSIYPNECYREGCPTLDTRSQLPKGEHTPTARERRCPSKPPMAKAIGESTYHHDVERGGRGQRWVQNYMLMT